ncbi:amino acid ABC transporter permease [bacterium]|nr:amino acid ABC transporter permease [bacterium]NBX77938.1 amino acid ABC transporter permease [bacterium]
MGVIMSINFELLYEVFPQLMQGFFVSLQIALGASFLGILFGILIGIEQAKHKSIIYIFSQMYVAVIRGTPMLIQIAAMYYLLQSAGIAISAFWSAIISIGLNSGAYMSQVILSGIQSISKGQSEAAQVLGFTKWQTLRYIVLPQAIQSVMPSIGNEFVTLVKDSSLASTIGVYELTKQGEVIMSKTYDAPTIYFALGCMYFITTTVVSLIVHYFDKKRNHVVH